MAQVKRKKKNRLIGILAFEIVIIILLFAGLKLYSTMNKIQHNDVFDSSIQQNEEVEIGGYRNIAIFGVDSRDNDLDKSTHSDTIIVASIDNKTKDVRLASIYRDTYVNIPQEGYNKINAAYFKGGYSLALSTINTNFDLDIKEYVTVNFAAVVKAVDLVGGITLDIQENELKYLNGYVRSLNKINGTDVPGLKSAGTQTVNGTQATAYARIRYTKGGDFKRAERQRIVIARILDQVKSSDLSTINTIIDEIFPKVQTNLTTSELLSLATDVFSYNIVDQVGFPFEPDAHTYHKVSYVFAVNLQANVSKLHEFLFSEVGYLPSSTVQEYSTYIEGVREQ
jgi:LCP family protein required for cell wall assembly